MTILFYTGSQLASYVCSASPTHTKHPPQWQRSRVLPEEMSEFPDGSYALYTLYNDLSAKFDTVWVNNCTEHVRDLMVLVRHTSFKLFGVPQCSVDIDRVVCSRRLLRHFLHSLIYHPYRHRISPPSIFLRFTRCKPTRSTMTHHWRNTSTRCHLYLPLRIDYGFVV